MNMTQNNEAQILFKRVRTLISLRVLLITLFLGLPLLLELKPLNTPAEAGRFYLLIGSVYLLSIAYGLLLKKTAPTATFIAFQLALDMLLETVLISNTGGLASPFSFLYIITIVATAIFFQKRGGLLMALSGTVLFSLMTLAQQTKFGFFSETTALGNQQALYMLFLYVISFVTVGGLSGHLANQLREKERGFLDLRVFHEDIVHSMPSGLITTDLEGKITSFNRSATQITSISGNNALGKTWWELFNWQEIRNRFKDLEMTGRPQRFEGNIQTEVGTLCPLGVTISTLKNEQGEQTGIIGTFQDLTEIRNLEESVQKKERLSTIGEMAAGMAHEIRNPLASLSGSIQMLQKELKLSGVNKQLIDIAGKDADRLNTFVTEFLRFARPLPPQREWVNLHTLLSDTVQLLQNSAEHTAKIETHLLPTKDAIVAFVDPNQMKQVFWNLANNAHQAMPEGGQLTLSTERIFEQEERGIVRIQFKDNGVGILEQIRGNIFSPFFTTKSAGSGLGLPIVQRIIEEHAGEITVSSRAGKTLFQIDLPFTSDPSHIASSSSNQKNDAQPDIPISTETPSTLSAVKT